MALDVEKEKFRRRFPTLTSEVEEEALSTPVDLGATEDEGTKTASDPKIELTQKKPLRGFDGYNPTVVDFIRRCESEKDAQEIIEYMEKTGEIGRSEAQKMRNQLRTKGLRSFGAKKEYGYYLKNIE